MECIDDYLNLNPSYKERYIRNNEGLKNEECSTENIFLNICYDVDIILNTLGISPSKFGYKYWKDAIYLSIVSERRNVSICNEIYPAIARKFNKSAISVERAMRLCFENTLYDNLKKQDNFIYSYLKNYLLFPHNSELLAKLTELVVSKEFQKNKMNA